MHRPAQRAVAITIAGCFVLAPVPAQQTATPQAQTKASAQAQGPTTPTTPATATVPTKTDTAPPTSASGLTLKQRHAAEKAYLEGVRAMDKGDVRTATQAFAEAAAADSSNREYALDREIARQHLLTELVQQADKARLTGHPDVARARLEEALSLDPRNPIAAQHQQELTELELGKPTADDPTATIASAIELQPSREQHSFHIKGSQSEVLRQVLGAYGLTPVLDSSVGPQTIRFDADEVGYERAAELVQLATNSFFVPLDPRRVLVAKDTRENRRQYERVSLETLRLPGLSATEMADMGNIARNVFGAEQTTVQPERSTLTVRAPQTKLAALNKTFSDLLDGRSEVLLDVKLYEIDRTKTQNIGVQLPQSVTVFNVPSELNNVLKNNQSLVNQIISSGLAAPGDYTTIAAILIASGQVSGSILSQPFAVFGNGLTLSGLVLGGVQANLSLNSSDVRALDDVQLRMEDTQDATFRSGTRYPIITSSYSSLSSSQLNIPGITSAGLSSALAGLGVGLGSSTQQQPIPQVQYEDLGLTLKATPRVGRNDHVALKLDFKLQALAGASLNSIPVLTNRSYTADIDLENGSSALVISDLSRQESKAVSGLPGLSDLPGFQSTTNDSTQFNLTNLVMLITPHIVRHRGSQLAGPVIPLPRHE